MEGVKLISENTESWVEGFGFGEVENGKPFVVLLGDTSYAFFIGCPDSFSDTTKVQDESNIRSHLNQS